MITPTSHIRSSTKEKYLKFKTRLEKNISSGRFQLMPRRKKRSLVRKVEKFKARLERLSLSPRGTTIAAGSVAAALVPAVGTAQIDPNFYLNSSSGISITSANNAVIANIDTDEDQEIIFATGTGGVIADFDGQDGYETSSPGGLSGAIEEIFAGDIDGDGHVDLIFYDRGDATYFTKAINNGYGYFSSTALPSTNNSPDVDFVDWDSDGDLDIVAATYGNYFEVLQNDGSGNFTNIGNTYLGIDNVWDLEFADVDNDGDMDLIHVSYVNVFPYPSTVRVIENTTDGAGTPTLDTASPTYLEQLNSQRFDGITMLDFDGDDDLDVFFHQRNGGYGYARKNNHIEGSSFTFDEITIPLFGGISSGSIEDAAVADFDNDGDDDLILAATSFNRFFSFDGTYLNATGGNLGGELGDISSYFEQIVVGDISGDDNIDLVGVDSRAGIAQTYLDFSAPFISDATDVQLIFDENTPPGERVALLTFDDLQGDPVTAQIIGPDASFFDLDDLTGDLRINAELDWETKGSDILLQIEMSDGSKTSLLEGPVKINNLPEKGNGTFDENAIAIFGDLSQDFFQPGDLDLDGDQDLFITHSASGTDSSYVFEQTGGSFISSYVGALEDGARYMVFNRGGSGYLDLLAHDQQTGYLVSIRNNDGVFDSSSPFFSTSLDDVDKMILGDFDEDGMTDLAVHFRNGDYQGVITFESDIDGTFIQDQYLVLYNSLDGSGYFGSDFYGIEVADFDSDGFDDLVVVAGSVDDAIFSGTASGFSTTPTTLITENDYGFASSTLGDFNGDGFPDLAIAHMDAMADVMFDVHLNDGLGNLPLSQRVNMGGEYGSIMRAADLDGDGIDDVIATVPEDFTGGEFVADLNVLLNDGTGTFSVTQTIDDVGGFTFKFIDIDGDDDLDIILEDDGGPDYLKVFENINVAPTAINLSTTSVDEHSPVDSQVATVTVDDSNPNDTHVISLVEGDGVNDEHNSFFTVDGGNLFITRDVAFEDLQQLNIYLSAFDGENLIEQAFVIDVNDVNQAPTGISLSATAFDEGIAPGSEVATLSAIDANAGDTHEFDFAVGDGTNDADNGSFVIDGDRLIIVEDSKFETKATYNIYLTASDIDGSVEEAFTLTVNDTNQAPTAIDLSSTSLDEGTAIGTTVATITVTDPNAGDAHDLSLVAGDGTNDANNDFFVISGSDLILIQDVDFDENESLNIYLSADDGEETFEQAFTLTVNDALGLEDEVGNVLGIYPNPGQNKIQLNIDNDLQGELTVQITDLGGKIVERFSSSKLGTSWSHTIDMTAAEPGIYMVQVQIAEQRFTQRWIKN